MTIAPDDRIYVNSIDGVTGQYLLPPLDISHAGRLARGQAQDPGDGRWLKRVWRIISQPHLGLPLGVDPTDIRQAGWAVVFDSAEDQAVKNALAALVDHRRRQIGDDKIVKVLEYRSGESRAEWLGRHGVGAGNVVPRNVPLYVLLVGSPERTCAVNPCRSVRLGDFGGVRAADRKP